MIARTPLLVIAALLVLCALSVTAQYVPEYEDDSLVMSPVESQSLFEENQEFAEHVNPQFFVRSIARGFRSASNWVRDTGRRAVNRASDFGKRAGNSIANTGKRAGNFIANNGKKAGNFVVNNGKIAGGWVVNTAKTAGNAIKNAFVPNVPSTGVQRASSKGPNYAGSSIRSIHDAVRAYTPIVWLHKDEKWFPTSAAKLADWSKVNSYQLVDPDYQLPLTFEYGKKFDASAPVYANVKKNDAGHYLITYAFVWHFNDCGPHVRVWASASFLKLHQRFYACPIGIHNGDIEHVTLNVHKDTFKINQVTFAYHSFDATVPPTQIEWEGTRPVFYSAKGSHATYLTPADQQYLKIWDERTTGAATFGYLEDYPGKGFKWTPTARWLAVGGAIDEKESKTPLTEAERKFITFKGMVGPKITKASAQSLKNNLMTFTSPIRKLKSSWDKAIKAQIESIDKELQPTSISSIGQKSWFGPGKNDL